MTADAQPGFSTVGLEYAKRYKELTEARETFNSERRKLLVGLADVVSASLEKARLDYSAYYPKKPSSKLPKDDVDEWTWHIERSYSQAWNSRRKKSDRKSERSGVELWLSDAEDLSFGFHAFVWFSDDKYELFGDDDVDDKGAIVKDHRVSREVIGRGIVASPENIWQPEPRLRMVTESIDAKSAKSESDFSLDSLANKVQKLPKLFVQADDLMAKYYEERTRNQA